MAVSQLIKITFYQHKIEAIGWTVCGVAKALKVESILGYCLRVGENKTVPDNTKQCEAAKQVLSKQLNQLIRNPVYFLPG